MFRFFDADRVPCLMSGAARLSESCAFCQRALRLILSDRSGDPPATPSPRDIAVADARRAADHISLMRETAECEKAADENAMKTANCRKIEMRHGDAAFL